MRQTLTAVLVLFTLVACGPAGRGEDLAGADASSDTAPRATLTGTVWAPNQGPGQAPAGQEIPIAGALVYVATARPEPIPDHVYCEQCLATPDGGVLTGADGGFLLEVPPGTYWVVIQKGQFRIEAQYELKAGELALTSEQSTLPSVWDPETGRYMPKMALAEGTNDNIEDILGKLGVGTMNGSAFGSAVGEKGPEIAFYRYASTTSDSVRYLLQHLDEMRKYHILFFPCSVDMRSIDALLRDESVLANVRRYVSEGGKLYVTDWSGELVDRAFPSQIELGDLDTDSTGTYDPETLSGTLATIGDADGELYAVSDGKAVDADLAAWLGLQSGPSENGAGITLFNPAAFEVTDLWNWVKKLNAVQIGVDTMGDPVYDVPKVWVTGSKPATPGAANRPIAVTYQPAGCGKVLYTPFQTANGGHSGLYPQERVLLYLIMEISTCSDSPIL